MLFARQGRLPAVYENPNRWDNYLHPDRALPVRARAVPPGFFHPPNQLIQENYQTKPKGR